MTSASFRRHGLKTVIRWTSSCWGRKPCFLVTVRLVGVIQAEQTEPGKTFRNDRLMGAIETSVNRPAIQTLADLQPERLDEIESFFMAYNHLEGRHFKPLGRHGPARAEQLLADGIRQCGEAQGSGKVEQPTAANDHR
jgi:inorganic pyrophosphatase